MSKSLPLPKECETYIAALPPSWQNNLRSIVRNDFKRIMKLNPMLAETILQRKYDLPVDCDRTAADYSDRSVINNQENNG